MKTKSIEQKTKLLFHKFKQNNDMRHNNNAICIRSFTASIVIEIGKN